MTYVLRQCMECSLIKRLDVVLEYRNYYDTRRQHLHFNRRHVTFKFMVVFPPLANEFCLLRGVDKQSVYNGLIYFGIFVV